MKTGLVMEGGAMRGMYTAGVLDVWMEQGITFDGAIGVSAGACFGCNFKSRQIGRAIRYNKRYCRDLRYGTFRSVLKTGDIYDVTLCYHLIPEELDPFDFDTYEENPMPFYAVATDMDTGMPIYHRCDTLRGKEMEWVRASASMPLVSRPVEIDGHRYSDGGTADSVPLAYFQSIGYDRNVVILTQPSSYRKHKSLLDPVMKLGLFRYPNLSLALRTRPDRYNENIAYVRAQEAKGNTFVLSPEKALPVKRTEHNPQNLETVYQMGRADAMTRLPELQAFLEGSRRRI